MEDKVYVGLVDGYSTGRLFQAEVAKRGMVPIHIRSTEEPFESLGVPVEEDYAASLIYRGDLSALTEELDKVTEGRGLSCVIAASEPGVQFADQLGNHLKLPTQNDFSLTDARRNKFLMREAVKRAGLAVPAFFRSADKVEILDKVRSEFTFPVVIKPLSSAGTDGVTICHSEDDVARACDAILGKDDMFGKLNAQVIVESFLEGEEYVVNSVSCAGKHRVNDIWIYKKRLVNSKPIYDREVLLDFEGEEQVALVAYVHKVLNALGLAYGPSHAEIMLTADGPVLVEVGARISGATNLEASQVCIGYDVVNLTLDAYMDSAAFNRRCEDKPVVKKFAMVVDLATEQEGVVAKETLSSRLSGLSSLKRMLVKVKPGDQITPTTDLLSAVAKFHMVHEDPEQLTLDYLEILRVAQDGFEMEEAPVKTAAASSVVGGETDAATSADISAEAGVVSGGASGSGTGEPLVLRTPDRGVSAGAGSGGKTSDKSSSDKHSAATGSVGFWTTPSRESGVSVSTLGDTTTFSVQEVVDALDKINERWSKTARVMKYTSDSRKLPEFEVEKPDFLPELLPFHGHDAYISLSDAQKTEILTKGWLLYNKKTVAIETEIITPVCNQMVRHDIPGLTDPETDKAAGEAMMDEAFHTHMVVEANNWTIKNRGVTLPSEPEFTLIRELKRAIANEPCALKQSIMLVATAVVSECLISDYLDLLSHSEEIQRMNRIVTKAHWYDEIRHGKVFKLIAKKLYASLDPEHKRFFAESMVKPMRWFVDKDLLVWSQILKEMGVPEHERIIHESEAVKSKFESAVDYTGVYKLAAEIGIDGLEEHVELLSAGHMAPFGLTI